MKSQVLVLSGGVGGAKLALGMYRVLPADELTVVVNTGDDFTHLGLRICPDIDTTLYTLAGVSNTELGWGRADESWHCLDVLKSLGGETWFQLGDKDIALHLLRTQALASGKRLSEVVDHLRQHLGIGARILPMSDQIVATELNTDIGRLPFQEYFVKQRCAPAVSKIDFVGAAEAQPLPELIELVASDALRAIIIAPSNPFLSIEPILAVSGMRELLARAKAPVIAISPLIGDAAVKGPTAKIMRELNLSPSAVTIQNYYRDLLDGFVFDQTDVALKPEMSVPCLCTRTLMNTLEDRDQLARDVLAFADTLTSSDRFKAHGVSV